MIISNPISRSIYPQTGAFAFQFAVVLPNTTGSVDFGFSGSVGVMNYRFVSGRVLDNASRFVGGYTAGSTVSLSGVIAPDTYDIYLNGQPRAFGLSRATGLFDTIYVNPKNVTADFSLYVNGDLPAYSFSPTIAFSTGDAVLVTGYLKNDSSQPFSVLSGDYFGDSSFSLISVETGKINTSGKIIFQANGQAAGGYHTLPMSIYTDFGLLETSLSASGIQIVPPSYFIDLNGSTDFTNLFAPINFICSFGNLNGSLTVVPSLSYLAGSGSAYQNVFISGFNTGSLIATLTGSGWMSGWAYATGTSGAFSGVVSGYISGFAYATGTFNHPYSAIASGWATGNGFSGVAIGILSGAQTVTITSGSVTASYAVSGFSPTNLHSLAPIQSHNATGLFSFTGIKEGDLFFVGSTGIPIAYPYIFYDAVSLVSYLSDNTGIHRVTATVTGDKAILTAVDFAELGNGLAFYADSCNLGNTSIPHPFLTGGYSIYATGLIPSGIYKGTYSETILATGTFSQVFSQLLTGQISGLLYHKDLTGIWSFKTGTSSAPVNLVSVPVVGDKFVGAPISGSQKTFYLQVSYNNPSDLGSDFASLLISGVNFPTSVALTLSGNAS